MYDARAAEEGHRRTSEFPFTTIRNHFWKRSMCIRKYPTSKSPQAARRAAYVFIRKTKPYVRYKIQCCFWYRLISNACTIFVVLLGFNSEYRTRVNTDENRRFYLVYNIPYTPCISSPVIIRMNRSESRKTLKRWYQNRDLIKHRFVFESTPIYSP